MKNYVLTLCLVLALFAAFGQQKYTISGIVTDGTSSESLIGATVYEYKNLSGTSTNLYGFYSITLPGGEVSISFSFIGYESKMINKLSFIAFFIAG